MASPSHQNLRAIRFEGELLPNWAQLLDVASRLCLVSEKTRDWFSRLTNSNGVDDARTILKHCELLRTELKVQREQVLSELRRERQDAQATRVFDAWLYALDTMMQQAVSKQTCSWLVEGVEQSDGDDSGDGGEITMRRV